MSLASGHSCSRPWPADRMGGGERFCRVFVSDSIPQRSKKYRFGRQKWFDSFSLDHVFFSCVSASIGEGKCNLHAWSIQLHFRTKTLSSFLLFLVGTGEEGLGLYKTGSKKEKEKGAREKEDLGVESLGHCLLLFWQGLLRPSNSWSSTASL